MSCSSEDKNCETPRRNAALIVLVLMAVIFLVLSAFSFVDSRGQVTPDQISYKGFSADEGKRVFQAYNCMGCHTIVGNGAYLGPDLTKEYKHAGPAWLEAFLPSAGSWPTAAAVRTHLATPEQLALAEAASWDDYLAKYPGSGERIERRGGQPTHMPNLAFREGEVAKLIAFLKYTSAMDNEGWPPAILSGDLQRRLALAGGAQAAAPATSSAAAPGAAAPAVAADPVKQGEQLVASLGCVACHATDASRKVGPGWGGVYGHEVELADGSKVKADKDYLRDSILKPNAQVVAGFPAGVMPSYEGQLKDDELDAVVAYLASLSDKKEQP